MRVEESLWDCAINDDAHQCGPTELFRDTFPCFVGLRLATFIFFGSVCNYILAVLLTYHNVYFKAASTLGMQMWMSEDQARSQAAKMERAYFYSLNVWHVTICEVS